MAVPGSHLEGGVPKDSAEPVEIASTLDPPTREGMAKIVEAEVDDLELMHDLVLVGLRPSPGLIWAGVYAGDQVGVRGQICC